MKFFEDIVIGEQVSLGSHTFMADDIKTFARRYDPQPFHLDEEAAARSHFGALCASGWHTAATWMRLMVEYQAREDAALRARGEAVAALGPSPGFRELKWIKPVYAGDTISYVNTCISARPTASWPGWGVATHHNAGINQYGEKVFEFTGAVLWQRKPG